MVTLNTLINSDAFEFPVPGCSSVAARFGVDHPVALIVTKTNQPVDSRTNYQIAITAEGNKPRYDMRGIRFETSTSGLTINVQCTSDVDALKAVFLSAAEILDMYQEDHVPESIAVTVGGLRNRMLEACIFDEHGEPRLEVPMFTKTGEFISPELPVARMLNEAPKGHLSAYSEFNHLRVTNLNQFLHEYENNIDYYASPYAILAQLEAQVKYEQLPGFVSVPYKDGGDVLFDFVQLYQDGGRRIVEYTYTGSVS